MNLNPMQCSVLEQFNSFLSSTIHPRETASGEVPTFFIGGYAGTGKTTMLAMIVDAAKEHLSRFPSDREGFVHPAAPTNKAAKRLRSKIGCKVTTLHYLLGAQPKMYLTSHLPGLMAEIEAIGEIEEPTDKDRARREKIIAITELLQQISVMEGKLDEMDGSNVAEERRLAGQIQVIQEKMMDFPMGGSSVGINDIIVCDESSMVGADLRDKIYALCPAAVVWVGDPGQLDPVKSPRWFEPPAQTTLTQVMRQGEGSGILKLVTLIREKETTNTQWLAKQLAGHTDVEFLFERKGDVIDFDYLAAHYGDRWLTWRNSYKTRNHRYHTRKLNEAFRSTIGFDTPYPQRGDRLYVTGRFQSGCTQNKTRGVFLSKGDELIVDGAGSLNADRLRYFTLNQSPATYKGFEKTRTAPKNKESIAKTDHECVCDLAAAIDGRTPIYCNGRGEKEGVAYFHDTCSPWIDIATDTHAIHAFVSTWEHNSMQFETLLDPSDLLWDEAQRTDIWRVDQYHLKECRGDINKSASPTKAILKTSYGYCISVHQSQGSEWPACVVFWDSWMAKSDPKNAVRWLYTACSRASERLCIVTI